MERRSFIKTASLAAAASTVLSPSVAFGNKNKEINSFKALWIRAPTEKVKVQAFFPKGTLRKINELTLGE